MRARLLLTTIALVATTAAHAQPDLRAAARRHFDQGVALFESQNLEGALAEFQEAQRLHPHPRILLNIAATQEAMHDYLAAIATLDGYLADTSVARPDRREAEAHLRELRALLARIEVIVDPPGAEVWVDGRLAGTAPLPEPVVVASGNHSIEARKRGYRAQVLPIAVAAGARARADLSLAIEPARLRLESNAQGGRVRVDGGQPRATPVELDLAPGRHAVVASARGFTTSRAEVVLAPGEERTFTMVLERPTATLRLRIGPPAARLWVDGERRPTAGPLRAEAGLHRIRVEGSDLVPWEDDVQLVAGRERTLDVRLGRDRVWLRPAVFWGGVLLTAGLAVAAAVTGIQALVYYDAYNDPASNSAAEQRALRDDAQTTAAIADAVWVGAGVSAVATTVLFLLSRGEPPDPQVELK
ncbi:MAG: PEGA domain-containing protein [Deltaproteobacteria bacterium]|nr:PEGA domain-containing protein [Deltaproteobacteria bacterium]